MRDDSRALSARHQETEFVVTSKQQIRLSHQDYSLRNEWNALGRIIVLAPNTLHDGTGEGTGRGAGGRWDRLI